MRPKLLCVFTTVSLMTILLGGLSQPSHSSAQGSDFSTIAASQNQFAFDFYQQIRDDNDDNLIFSGYSIWQALAMVYAGARGNTESQMATALHYDLPQSELHSMIAGLNADIASRSVLPEEMADLNPELQPLQLNIANGIWGQSGAPFEQAFMDISAQQYQSEMFQADFANGSISDIASEINRWATEQTQGKISDIISPNTLTRNTMMVLVNAIYFKGSWGSSFSESATQDAPFYLTDGRDVTVPMMFQNGTFRYAVTDSFEAVELPYAGGTAAMILILPKGSLEIVEQTFDLEMFNGIRSQMETTTIFANLYVPKFEFLNMLGLDDPMKTMGMIDAFDPNKADFSGILSPEIAQLFVSTALQKAYIKIDEAGTEAAAVTGFMVGGVISEQPQPIPVEIRFDHPFLYAIYDKPTGTILFMGRVMNPAE
ncbi:MAG: serine/threonine protein kinase [Chloroflexota bacterium]|nr:MAG: serine/threonine protein kinase [Chloroflexota bacterium]